MATEPANVEKYLAKVLPPANIDFSGVSVLRVGWDKFLQPHEVYQHIPKDTLMETKGGKVWRRTRFGVRDFVTNRFLTLKQFAKKYPTVNISFYDKLPCPKIMELREASIRAIRKEFAAKTTRAKRREMKVPSEA